MSKFKVGDRVKANGGYSFDPTSGVVTEIYGSVVRVIVGAHGTWSYHPEHLELVPVAEATATLKIEAGKYYKTRDGRKVGQMEPGYTTDQFRDASENITGYGWFPNGSYIRGVIGNLDLIAEWVDDTVAEQHGGRMSSDWGFTSADGRFTIKNGSISMKATELRLPSLPTPAIVALIEDGKAKPAVAPKLHQSRDAALKEADRLAGKYLGQVFGVFELTSKTQKELNYDHEWQRLAANGNKISAIKEIRQLTGFGLKAAKDGIEDWLSRHVATLRNAA